MGRFSAAVIGIALAGGVAAQAVDEVLGTKDGEYVSVTPAEVVDDGLPAKTGHGAECLKVNTGATAFEYGECASGGGADLSDDPPVIEGTAAPGSASDASRGDHVHPKYNPPLSVFGTVGGSGTCAKANSTRNGLTYGSCGSPRALSNFNPLVEATTADPGNRTDVSRADHVHPTGGGGGGGAPLSDTPAVALKASAGAGAAQAASRQDHVHPQTGLATSAALTAALSRKPDLGSDAPVLLKVAASAGVGTSASRQDHVHPNTGLPTVASVTANKTALEAHRQVPDPAHVANGHVLTANSGAYSFAAPSGGGSGGGGSADWVNFIPATNVVSEPNGSTISTFGTGFTASSCHDSLTSSTQWAAIRFRRLSSSTTISASANWTGNASYASGTIRLFSGSFGARGAYAQLTCSSSAVMLAFYSSESAVVPTGSRLAVDVLTSLGGGGGGGGTATPLSDGLPKIEGTAAAGTGTAASRGDHVHPRVFPKPAAGTADKGKTFGIASDGQTLQIWDPYVVVNSGIPDFDGKAGECLVVSGDDESDYAVAYQPCDDVAEIERDIDGLQAITGDILLGRAEPGPAWVLNSLDKSGGIAWITGSSLTPDLSGVTFQTNTVARPGSGWGVGSMIIRIIDSEDVRQWQQRDSLPGSANVDISHWPGNLWRLISPTNATAGYHYYLAHSPPNTSTVTQARLFRTNTSAHFGETEYYGKTPLVDAQIAALLKAPRRKLERSGTSTGCCNNDFLVVGTAQELANLAERVRDASTETITQLELHISYTTANSGTARRILPMGGMPLGVNGGMTETNDFIGQHANLELFADGQFRLAADFNSGNTTVTWQVISITEQTKQ